MEKQRKFKSVKIDMLLQQGAQPPQNFEAEQMVLGACIMFPRAISKAAQYLTSEHFYNDTHREIYQTMLNMEHKGIAIDLVTIAGQLRDNGIFDRIPDGPYYITKLTNPITSELHLSRHCLIVLEKWILREFMRMGAELFLMSGDGATDFYEVSKYVTREREKIWSHYEKVKKQVYSEMVFERTSQVLANDGNTPYGLTTSFPSIDKIIIALSPQLIVIAARPSMGKTAFMVQLIENLEKQGPVGFIELESSTNSYIDRHLANVSGLNASDLKRGGLNNEQKSQLSDAASEIMSKKIHCLFDPMQDNYEIGRTITMWVEQYGVKAVALDYLQIMQVADEDEKKSRERQVTAQSQYLAALSVKLGIVIIAFAQLSREVLKRADKRPNLGDLRESGGIEQAARQVWFIHRPEYYIEPGKPLEDEWGNDLKGVTEIMILKNNEGDTGTARLRFDKYRSKFTDMEFEYWSTGEQSPTTITIQGKSSGWKPLPGMNPTEWEGEDAPF